MLIEHPNAQLIDHINIIKLQSERKYSDDSHELLMSLKVHIVSHSSQDKTFAPEKSI